MLGLGLEPITRWTSEHK